MGPSRDSAFLRGEFAFGWSAVADAPADYLCLVETEATGPGDLIHTYSLDNSNSDKFVTAIPRGDLSDSGR